MSEKNGSSDQGTVEQGSEDKICGLVMPISSIDGCNEQHWLDVKGIITDAVMAAGFTARIVSEAEEGGIIHSRIIQNLYDDPIIICDVSGKNPNVMFELGIRLAFDKPTIIIKDDKTPYSFDTSSIEHLEYPRDLRFNKIIDFKKRLKEKVTATLKKSESDPNYRTFLQHFGKFKVAELETKEISKEDYIISELNDLKKQIQKNSKESSLISSYNAERSMKIKSQIMQNEIESAVSRVIPNYDLSTLLEDKTKEKILNTVMKNKKLIENFSTLGEVLAIFESEWDNFVVPFE